MLKLILLLIILVSISLTIAVSQDNSKVWLENRKCELDLSVLQKDNIQLTNLISVQNDKIQDLKRQIEKNDNEIMNFRNYYDTIFFMDEN